MRVSIIGYGAVADVHADGLKTLEGVRLSAVAGPSAVKAEAFAHRHGFGMATASIGQALQEADAAIVCSPSAEHAHQTMLCLDHRVPVLVELPACSSLTEASQLQAAAEEKRTLLRCAHTARYLEPFQRVRALIQNGELGELGHFSYSRLVPPRIRSWQDDALLHHAAHTVDLLLDWFGRMRFEGCIAKPEQGPPQSVAILAVLPGGAPASISISYETWIADCRMVLSGTKHTVFTDGFSYLESDEIAWRTKGDGDLAYRAAIRSQDEAFLQACRTASGGVPWSDTVRLMKVIEELRVLAAEARNRR